MSAGFMAVTVGITGAIITDIGTGTGALKFKSVMEDQMRHSQQFSYQTRFRGMAVEVEALVSPAR